MANTTLITDLTRGIYRRIYAGFLNGRRINSVTVSAEAWFWRLNAVADDFGNFRADPKVLSVEASPRRKISPEQCEKWMDELERVSLIGFYTVEGDRYGYIVGFKELQPAGKNGRRVQRFPVNPGESKIFLGFPEKPGSIPSHHSDTDTDTDSDSHQHQHQHNGVSAAVAVGSINEKVGYLMKRPEWVPDGKGWINKAMANELARLPLTQDQVDGVIRDARKSRTTLKNPAGYVVAELRKAAQA